MTDDDLRSVEHPYTRSEADWNAFVERYRQHNARVRRRGWIWFVVTVAGILGLVGVRMWWG